MIAANLGVAVMWMQAIISGVFPWSHHWIFPAIGTQLLAQSFMFHRRGPHEVLTGLGVLLLVVAVARLQTIFLSHHLIHFAMAFALVGAMHLRLGTWATTPDWRFAHRVWAVGYAAVAVVSSLVALHYGIWWNDSP